jgi:pimeloyl-ACP methyl ester carboxylesterase
MAPQSTDADSGSDADTSNKPDKKITYATPHDEEGGCLFLYGAPDAAHIVLTCAGYPDDHGSFGPLAQRLAKESNCLVGVTCLPGFDDRPENAKPWRSHHKAGYSFLEMAASLHEAVKVLRAHSTNPKAKFTAIFHDWGVVPGLMLTNRALKIKELDDNDDNDSSDKLAFCPDQVVLFDVCLDPHPKTANVPVPPRKSVQYIIYDLAVQVSYRLLLAICFILQRYVSSQIALLLMGSGFALLTLLNLNPTRNIDRQIVVQQQVGKEPAHLTYMAYPYFYLWKIILTGRLIQELKGGHLPKDLTATPVLYLYGLDKNIQFHQDNAVALLQQENEQGRRSKAIAVKDAGHWLYLQQAEHCFAHVNTFIQELK